MPVLINEYYQFKDFIKCLLPLIEQKVSELKYAEKWIDEDFKRQQDYHKAQVDAVWNNRSRTGLIEEPVKKQYKGLRVVVLMREVLFPEERIEIDYGIHPLFTNTMAIDGKFERLVYDVLVAHGIKEKFPNVQLPKLADDKDALPQAHK